MSDLRANNELLQQRLDQIAQGYNNGPSRLMSTDAQAMTAAATAGSFPRSFLIPGTDTSIRVGGNITWIADYYLEGGNPNGSPWSTTIGANGQVQAIAASPATASKRSSNIFRRVDAAIEVVASKPAPRRRMARRGPIMSFDWAGSTALRPGRHRPDGDLRQPRPSSEVSPTARWAGGWPVRRTRTSPTPTRTRKPSTSAATSANRAASVSRSCATRCP